MKSKNRYFATINLNEQAFQMATILVLNYHRIVHSGEYVDPLYTKFTLDVSVFQQQLDLIQQLGIHVVDLANLSETTSLPPFCIGITFDDGHLSDLQIAAPLLEKNNFPATFFPVINQIGTENFMTWDDLTTLLKMGFTIGSHSFSHPHLTDLNQEDQHQEIVESRRVLEEKLGILVQLFSIPYGESDVRIIQTIQSAGYTGAFSTVFGTENVGNTTPFLWKRWNIKRTTKIRQFEKVLSRQALTLFQLNTWAKIKLKIVPIKFYFTNHN